MTIELNESDDQLQSILRSASDLVRQFLSPNPQVIRICEEIGYEFRDRVFNPMITLFGFTLARLLSGAFLVEVVMSWPGLGRLTLDALFARDLYLVMGSLLMASTLLILGNMVADILLAITDPRISYD